MGIARYLSKLASGLSSEGVIPAAKGGTGSTNGASGGPKISSIAITDSSYTVLDDTAVDVAGGYIKITGSGFASGCQVLIGTVPTTSVTFVSATEVRAQVPANTAGTYIVYLVNSDGGTAIRVNGITFSTTPTWTTESPLSGSADEAISIQLAATGAATFSVASGSSIPAGVSLSSSGLLTGTVTGISQETAYNFTILATDTELQDSPKAFTINISVGDPYFKNTTLLLSGNGTNNANNNTFIDSSSNNLTITKPGVANTSQGTFSPYGANWSNYFDGNGDYLTVASNAAFALGTGDFTVEFWFNVQGAGDNPFQFPIQSRDGTNTGFGAQYNRANGSISFFTDGAAAINIASNSGVIADGNWYHYAATRSGTTVRLFLNGTQVASATSAENINATGPLYISRRYVGDPALHYFNGYLSNMRLLKGTALYTSNFTPSTTPLTPTANTSLLTCQSNALVDSSINNFTITRNGDVNVQRFSPFAPRYATAQAYSANLFTSGSIQVNSTSVNPQVNSSLGTGAFTVEGWYYPTTSLTGKNARILSYGRDSAGGDTTWDLYINNGTALVWNRINTTATTYSGNYTFTTNNWYHLVVCRDSSGNLALFVNGTRVFFQAGVTTDYTYVAGSQSNHYIGASYNGTTWSYALGYYSNIRVIKTATAYDPTQSTLTVPTQPLTATAQTIMLLLSSNTGADIIGNYPAFSNFNSAQVKPTTFSPFTISTATSGYSSSIYGGSAYFDNSEDYLTAPASAALSLGTGNFTLEAWVYNVSGFSTDPIFECRSSSSSATGYAFAATTGGYLNVYTNGAFAGQSSTVLTTGTWNHVALVRTGTGANQTTYYINGVASGTITLAGNFTDASSAVTTIGGSTSAGENWGGYISDARIIKGTALYTNNFIPPSTPLTAVTNTQLLLKFSNAGVVDSTMQNNLETAGNAQLSTAVSKFGGSSMSFDGTGDYLKNLTTPLASLQGDFTIECWLYWTAHSTYGGIVSCANNNIAAAPTSGWAFVFYSTSNKLYFETGTGFSLQTTNTIPSSEWNHVAVVRSGSTITHYLNGVANGSGTSSAAFNVSTTDNFVIGVDRGLSNTLTGYIDDLRITRGYARYTSNFTAPTAAFPTK